MTTAEAAELLGVTVRGIQQAAKAGKLPATRIGQRVLVFRRVDLLGYRASKKKPGRKKKSPR